MSPQRRSFGTGCHGLQIGASSNLSSGGRPDSPSERSTRESHREIQPRRIGSGRIVRREDSEQPPNQPTVGTKERNVPGSSRRDNNRDVDQRRDLRERDVDQRRDNRDWRSKPNNRYDRDDGSVYIFLRYLDFLIACLII